MIKTTLTVACAVFALVLSTNANAQDCGCGSNYSAVDFGGYGGYSSYGNVGATGLNNCGRAISNQQAASLWAGYCTETCVTGKKRCGLFSGCGKTGGCGGGGCSQGCFGYPTGGCGSSFSGGCGTASGLGGGCKLFSKLKAGAGGCGLSKGCGFGGGNSCGLGGFSGFGLNTGCGSACGGGCGSSCGLGGGFGLFDKLKSGGGCNLFSKLKGKSKCAAIVSYPVTTVAIDQCGCGNSGQYFNYAVGHEYGTAGIQSSVAGSLTSACGGCSGSTMMSPVINMPAYGTTGAAPIVEQGTPCQ
ncbi:hypothetical protein [Mariniblastus fucicola]|uniref:Uncharacterized protein n=1 Tax=Mariniblastus fucicola TaxID=980251 RepID=A0A5B9P6M2_9BACT|nr:hypothetical protein [Mariniblastus fucicola]QEG21924.1 hypothetical protein MFFC18_17850 [Mariniblastus fucicola]